MTETPAPEPEAPDDPNAPEQPPEAPEPDEVPGEVPGPAEPLEPKPGEVIEPPEALVDADAVARYLGTSTDWVRDRVRAGELPAVRVGPRLLRFRMAEVVAWADSRRVAAAS